MYKFSPGGVFARKDHFLTMLVLRNPNAEYTLTFGHPCFKFINPDNILRLNANQDYLRKRYVAAS